MKLFYRALVGLIVALMLTFVGLVTLKTQGIDPYRRQNQYELIKPTLENAAAALAALERPQDGLSQLRRRLGGKYQIERRDGVEDSGWFMHSDQMFAYQRIDGLHVLVYGPFPSIDPQSALLSAIALGVPLVVAGLAAFVLMVPLIRRIRVLERVTRRVADGDLSARMAEGGRDELSSLVRNFNRMGAEIEGLLASKQQLLQAVSHEFRTPAARIRFELELLQEASEPDERSRHIKGIDKNLEEMDALVDELIAYTRLDQNPGSDFPKSAVNPFGVAEALVSQSKDQRPDIDLRVRGEEDVSIWANEAYFRRALRNLLSNAIHHARSSVELSIELEGPHAIIKIHDDGQGIALADRERVFLPFVRLDTQTRARNGSGLGLAIVDKICDWHRASIEVETTGLDIAKGCGTVMKLRWPLPRAHELSEEDLRGRQS